VASDTNSRFVGASVIRHNEKSVHLLVASHIKKIFFAEFRQTFPVRFFTMRYD
jgi:hypothetical protein